MGFPDTLFPALWMWFGNIAFAAVMLNALRLAPWSRLTLPGRMHVWLAACVVLSVMWSLKAGVVPGQNLHLIGAGVLTLVFGPSLAMVALTVVLAATTLNGGAHWAAMGLNGVVAVVCPVLVVEGLRRAVQRWLPANFFIYVFLCAYFGAWIAVIVTGLFATALMEWAGLYPFSTLFSDYLLYFVLIGFSEAWLNGAAVTLMVVYAPQWVSTFDDRHYLQRK